jgi:hypothetical protein
MGELSLKGAVGSAALTLKLVGLCFVVSERALTGYSPPT